MRPRQLCNNLLHDCPVGPGISKGPHILEVSYGKAFAVRQGGAQIAGQLVDDLGTPAVL